MMTVEQRDQQKRRARGAANKAGVRMVERGKGNDLHVHFYWPSGQHVSVWYPEEGRIRDLDIQDLEEVIAMLTAQTQAGGGF